MTKQKAGAESVLWLGSLGSYAYSVENQARAEEALATGAYSYDQDEDDDEAFQGYDYMVQQIGSTAVVSIQGSLVPNSNFLTRMFGMTGYDEIANAVAAAASEPGISQILLDIDSPGGSTSGVEDAANMISKVNEEIMPVHAFTSGSMASAAYWIGSSAGNVYSTPMATVGSIGVIAIHQEYSRMLKSDGITPTVFRSGPYKALGTPYEPLSELAKTEIQSRVDALADHFVAKVAENRGYTTEYIKTNAAGGREFFGKDALNVGLIDAVATFEEVVKLIDKDHNSPRAGNPSEQYTGADTMLRKRVMTPEAQAAIAAGVPVQAALEQHGQVVEETAPAAQAIPDEEEQAAAPAAEAAEDETPTPETPAEGEAAEEEAPAAEAKPAIAASASDSPVSGLISELSRTQEALATTRADLRQAEQRLERIAASETGLRGVVCTYINHMQIGLGGVPSDFSHLDSETLLAQYSRTQTEFQSRFPVGAQAEVPVQDEDRADNRAVSLSLVDSGKIRATQFSRRREG